MALEAVTYIGDLVTANPLASDSKAEGANHLRNIKTGLVNTFPGMAGRYKRVQSKSSGYTVVANDNTSIIACTASLTITLTAASTLGNGFSVAIYNDSQTQVTVDGNSSETINGILTLELLPRTFAILFCDGTNFYALTGPSVDIENPIINSDQYYWPESPAIRTATTLVVPMNLGVGSRLYMSAAPISAMFGCLRKSASITVAASSIIPVYATKVISERAKTSFGATEYCYIGYNIEGYNARQIAQLPFNLSFWIRSSQTGIYNVAIANAAHDRSFVKSYNISAINTWEFKQFLIPASPSGGTWNYSAGTGMQVKIVLGAGTSFTVTTDNAWTAVNALASTAQANFAAALSASMRVTALNIWVGNEFKVWKPEDKAHAMCRINRYYFKTQSDDVSPSASGVAFALAAQLDASGRFGTQIIFPSEMRATPTVNIYNGINGATDRASNSGGTTTASVTTGGILSYKAAYFLHDGASASNANIVVSFNVEADARL